MKKNKMKRRYFMTEAEKKSKFSILDTVLISLFSALIAVCAWITIPIPGIPFTMQVFGVFTALAVLGAKKGAVSILVYILLGVIGIPVFSGFNGGISVLLGATGGYIAGFLVSAFAYGILDAIIKKNGFFITFFKMFASLILCYIFGSVWYMAVYTKNTGSIGFFGVLTACVIPYIIPDMVKIALAVLIGKEVKKRVRFL